MEKRTIALLQKESRNCAESKSPEKCKKAIAIQIAKSQAKIDKTKAKMSKATAKGKEHIVAAGQEKAKNPNIKAF